MTLEEKYARADEGEIDRLRAEVQRLKGDGPMMTESEHADEKAGLCEQINDEHRNVVLLRTAIISYLDDTMRQRPIEEYLWAKKWLGKVLEETKP